MQSLRVRVERLSPCYQLQLLLSGVRSPASAQGRGFATEVMREGDLWCCGDQTPALALLGPAGSLAEAHVSHVPPSAFVSMAQGEATPNAPPNWSQVCPGV